MARFIILALVLGLLTPLALSCSCEKRTFEERFCDDSLSVRGKVLATFDNCPGTCDSIDDQSEGKIFYIVKVIDKFKGPNVEDDILFLDTAVNGGLCGVNLRVGSEYLLNLGDEMMSDDGTCPDKTRGVGLCQFPTLWSDVSSDEMDFLETPTC